MSFQLHLFDPKSIFKSLCNVLTLLKGSFLIARAIKLLNISLNSSHKNGTNDLPD